MIDLEIDRDPLEVEDVVVGWIREIVAGLELIADRTGDAEANVDVVLLVRDSDRPQRFFIGVSSFCTLSPEPLTQVMASSI